jgi:hypothetical protein
MIDSVADIAAIDDPVPDITMRTSSTGSSNTRPCRCPTTTTPTSTDPQRRSLAASKAGDGITTEIAELPAPETTRCVPLCGGQSNVPSRCVHRGAGSEATNWMGAAGLRTRASTVSSRAQNPPNIEHPSGRMLRQANTFRDHGLYAMSS